MFARVTTFTTAPDEIESGISSLRNTIGPVVQTQPGFKGLLGLVDRQSGKMLAIGFWDTEQQLRTSEAAVTHLRSEMAKMTKSSQQPRIEIYEVAAQSGQSPASQGTPYARLTTAQVPLEGVQPLLDWAHRTLLPTLQPLQGFQGAYVLIDRANGKSLALTFWESENRLRAAEAYLNTLRAQGAQTGRVNQIPTSEHFEVGIRV